MAPSRYAAHDMPEPEPAAQAHSEALRQRIVAEIDSQGGAIPFRRYMELALYEPGLGYYASAGGAGLSAVADFVTAPELTPIFGRCVARACAEVLAQTGGDILEPGAGTGRLAAQVLDELEALGTLPERYRILEPSAELAARQAETLRAEVPHLAERCTWESSWPAPFDGVVLVNEVLDAMPVEGFRRGRDGVEQRCATVDAGGRLVDTWRPAPEAVQQAVAHIERDLGWALPEGYESEYNPYLAGWFAGLSGSLGRGALILVDYGYVRAEYYMPERSMGTLVCTRAHRAHDDPYAYPGLTDLSAFVDFTAVTEAAVAAGFELEGFTPQAHFLIGCGIDEVAGADLGGEVSREGVAAAQAIKRLTLPGQMGERFNAIGFSKGLSRTLSPFAVNDRSHRL